MNYDIICFCHLRWGFVYQRPQHLLSRFAKTRRVFLIEEPIFGAEENHTEMTVDEASGVWVVVPHLKNNMNAHEIESAQRTLLDNLLTDMRIEHYISWYYSPMALAWSNDLKPELVIYDCMDELSAFKFAPPALVQFEQLLLKKADLVFTGGRSLYEAKKHLHENIHAFPSSIDKEHFAIARTAVEEPGDQQHIPHPRIGFYGVLDERLDIELLREAAALRPDWHFVLIGPVVKIEQKDLPAASNIHYVGGKSYKELPNYLAGWDVAMLPFAMNESTKFISPTKTPEYLAGGKPVVSTPIKDVVSPYGEEGLVQIASTPAEFVAATETALAQINDEEWLSSVDEFLKDNSWDKTWEDMASLIKEAIKNKSLNKQKQDKQYV